MRCTYPLTAHSNGGRTTKARTGLDFPKTFRLLQAILVFWLNEYVFDTIPQLLYTL